MVKSFIIQAPVGRITTLNCRHVATFGRHEIRSKITVVSEMS
jgi:hypothetical protein